ncbi:MAG: Crp/Fnr family transcriptional regulator [Winogradskyella sp.]
MENHQESKCENCIVRELNALKVLSKEELKIISDSKTSKKIEKGEVIFNEGKKLKGVFCVRNGVSKLSKTDTLDKDHIVKIASQGQILGQRSIFANEKTNLSAEAINTMEVCHIPKKEFLSLLKKNLKFTQKVLELMAIDLRFADNALINMAQKTVPQRIALTLLYLEKNFGVDTDKYISLVVKREDIANLVGTAKEACIRSLTKLKKEGLIITNGKRIKIADHKRLQTIAEDGK